MKNKKYLCKIEYRNIITKKEMETSHCTNKISDIIEYAKLVRNNIAYSHQLHIIDNTTGELLMILGYRNNYYYICSSAYKMASKILKKI